MTAYELTIALFWMVVAGYVTYLGWSIYSSVRRAVERHRPESKITDLAGRASEASHPAIGSDDAEWFTVADEDRLAG